MGFESILPLEKPPPEWGVLCEVIVDHPALPIFIEKPPPKWGGVCEGASASHHRWPWPRETPTGVGRYLRGAQRSAHRPDSIEKPPPEWGGVCEVPVRQLGIL